MSDASATVPGTCTQCVQRVHHPHHGQPFCADPDCDCAQILWCGECGQPWPCTTKQAHVAERARRP